MAWGNSISRPPALMTHDCDAVEGDEGAEDDDENDEYAGDDNGEHGNVIPCGTQGQSMLTVR